MNIWDAFILSQHIIKRQTTTTNKTIKLFENEVEETCKKSTKSHKFSALEAEWRAEGSSELAVSPATSIMHIFESETDFYGRDSLPDNL